MVSHTAYRLKGDYALVVKIKRKGPVAEVVGIGLA